MNARIAPAADITERPNSKRCHTKATAVSRSTFRSGMLSLGATMAIACVISLGTLNAEESDAALRAAEDRLLDRLWQMPFYLTIARPQRTVARSDCGYGVLGR